MAEGYDTNRFQSTIDEAFICSICLGVLNDPMQCENNEHYFCSGCIKKHLEQVSHTCPTCQEKLSIEKLRKAPRIVEDCVSRYKIKCEHASRGCEAVVELASLNTHLRDCDFMPVTCSNDGCDVVMNKRDVKKHELELCRFMITKCDDCGEKMPHNKYGRHGCVLRRDVDEIKKDVADIKITQREMMKEVQRMTNGFEALQKSIKNSRSTDIIVIGGVFGGTEATLSVERFSLLNQTWTQLPGLTKARLHSVAVVFQNQVLVCGGWYKLADNHEVEDCIDFLDLNRNPLEWHEFCVKLPIKVAGHKCIVYGNKLFIIGGITKNKQLDTIYELLLIPPYSSKLLCHMNKKRTFHGVELFDDKICIAGGKGAETHVEFFDIKRNECIEMPPLKTPLWGMGTVLRGDTMLLIGGVTEDKSHSNEIIEYDLKTGQSKVLLTMANKRAACSCVFLGNTLIVVGGDEDDPVAVNSFNFNSNTWRKLPSTTERRVFSSAVVVDREIIEF